MKIALWIVQTLLAVAFFMAGATKTFTPNAELVAQMPWVADTPAFVPKLAGISEMLGAVGLILPAATRVLPALTPLAAYGLSLVMVLAGLLHASRGEFGPVLANTVLLGLSLFVAYGRQRLAPIAPRAPTRLAAAASTRVG